MSVFWGVAILLLMAITAGPVNALAKTYAPVATLNTEAYLGRWYQMATGAAFILVELGGNCVTADYELRADLDGKIALVNQARPLLLPKLIGRTTGFAVQSNVPTEQGAFTVDQTFLFSLDPDTVEYDAPGNYWIIGLGPIINGQYQWAAISDPDKTGCFILARNVKEYNKYYKQDAKQVFKDFGGFDNPLTNVPINTPHFLCLGYGNAKFT